MKPLHDSIDPQTLRTISPGDTVSFRLVNGEQVSGVVDTVSHDGHVFTFQSRGFRIHAIEIAWMESHRPYGMR